MKDIIALILCTSLIINFSCQNERHDNSSEESHTYGKWDLVTIDIEGPQSSEMDSINPFLDYRVEVLFEYAGSFYDLPDSYTIPAYYAADGNAAESSADLGNIWKAKFRPNHRGEWTYTTKFVKGKNIAVDSTAAYTEVDISTGVGSFNVGRQDKRNGLTPWGRLEFDGDYYFEFHELERLFIKAGPNSPENFLAYKDIDGTYAYDSTAQYLKSWSPHIQDWEEGNPTWKNGKGKGIIGALNYIASKGMNCLYFLTMNIEGDGKDVFPYVSHEDFTRFDCSKLAQWEIIFQHAEDLGIVLHFVTQETENETLLDGGDTGLHRSLYYRELVARFGHHLGVIWNLGEENGYAHFTPKAQNDDQRLQMIDWFAKNDPFDNPVVIHTHSWQSARDSILDPLVGNEDLDGISLQINDKLLVHDEIVRYRNETADSDQKWMLAMDEIGWYWKGAVPDEVDPRHDSLRMHVLWGTLMAGGAGVEWYFGYKYPPADLDCEDWRSRENLWDQTEFAKNLFLSVPLWHMKPSDHLVRHNDQWCFAKEGLVYVLYSKVNEDIILDVDTHDRNYKITVMNPVTRKTIKVYDTDSGLEKIIIEKPNQENPDYVVVLRKLA